MVVKKYWVFLFDVVVDLLKDLLWLKDNNYVFFVFCVEIFFDMLLLVVLKWMGYIDLM